MALRNIGNGLENHSIKKGGIMEGTASFELEPLLDLEVDFNFTPGSPAKLTGDPYYSEPGEDPLYEIEEIRAYSGKKWHKVPDWLWEILNLNYEEDLVEAVKQYLDQP
jgi:hypothetical protein